jgi:hypothetical protein
MVKAETTPGKTVEVKKVEEGKEVKKRIAPVRLRGWIEQIAKSFGPSVSHRSYNLGTGLKDFSIKKKTENDDGQMVTVASPVQVHIRGIVNVVDERVTVRAHDEFVAIQQEIDDNFTEGLASQLELDTANLTRIPTYTPDKLVRLKTKHFKGPYVSKYKSEINNKETSLADLDGKLADIIIRYYGVYVMEGCYGPLISVSAFNLAE